MTEKARMDKAMKMLAAIEDADAVDGVNAVLADLAPDYAKATVAYAFGDTYSRTDQLALRDREIATIAAMVAMGTAAPQLKIHIRSGLKVGLSQQEIVEIIGHIGVYAGFPAAANAFFAMREALDEKAASQKKAGARRKPAAAKAKTATKTTVTKKAAPAKRAAAKKAPAKTATTRKAPARVSVVRRKRV